MLLIAGVDSGTNFALSLINLEGELIYLNSGKNLEKEVLEICLKNGKVIAVATDKKESKKAKKIAASLSAELILPKRDLPKYKKIRLIEDFLKEKKLFSGAIKKLNSHEKSSLAAALFAYKTYKQKLKKFEDEIGISPLYLKEKFILSKRRVSCFK